ncbi:poly(glycerol-phosphate) alpha-glucosyltransferase [Microbacterium sp. AK009]|uniref:glycosyltransferase n=1 Tax=Microbacterium sp. AK009 TaxID=2723068 RepID=UPI0015CE6DD3|nr:glycosyltransferase [Microbacterium sp. AK009]NYF15385.1 poly(glycerol-phosphate) alpha-glucosyltransferase [Microbacterium sp. AK009]
MTSALLHRSRAFRREAGVDVAVLTLDDRIDYADVEARLREAGEVIDGVSLLNLYDWLRSHPLPATATPATRHPFRPLRADEDAVTDVCSGETVLRRERHGPGGEVLQVDHYRRDGSLVLSDRRDLDRPGRPAGRSVVVCDEEGRPQRGWSHISGLYAAWIDALTTGSKAWLIVDSKTTARHLLGYRRRGTVMVHVVHGAHGRHGAAVTEPAEVVPSRRAVFSQLHAFDAVVFLTGRQRDDVARLTGRRRRLVTIPLGITLPVAPPRAEEERAGAVVLARLSALKRVDHAIAAVQRVNGVLRPPLTLDIWGDGSRRASLASRIGGDPAIRLHHHDPAAREVLPQASVLLVTSRSEGFGLVILEAMAAGCIPVAYDVPYGPGEIIQDGRNGMLVADGDVDALAEAVRAVVSQPAAAREAQRQAARERAAQFSDERVTRLWGRALRRARRRSMWHRAIAGVAWRARRWARVRGRARR